MKINNLFIQKYVPQIDTIISILIILSVIFTRLTQYKKIGIIIFVGSIALSLIINLYAIINLLLIWLQKAFRKSF